MEGVDAKNSKIDNSTSSHVIHASPKELVSTQEKAMMHALHDAAVIEKKAVVATLAKAIMEEVQDVEDFDGIGGKEMDEKNLQVTTAALRYILPKSKTSPF
eukprot:g595.t1